MKTSLLSIKAYRAANHKLCPECGSRMRELDRVREGSITYVWFECVQANCNGQWMQTYPGLISKQLGQSV